MVDELTNDENGAHSDESSAIRDLVTDLATEPFAPGVPAPVRRSFFKALGQWCSAAIDIPISHLTGLADERRAVTAARIKLTETSAEQMAQQMQTDPEYARVAADKFASKIIREQVNLDKVSLRAANEVLETSNLIDQSGQEDLENTITDDWLNIFEIEARQKSSEEMQAYFGRVLAGEILKPGSFSIRTVRILASLDQETATHFARLCSLCISFDSGDVRVPSLAGDANANALQEYGLPFATLNLLNEHGLIISEYNSVIEYIASFGHYGDEQKVSCRPFTYLGKHWILRPVSRENVGQTIEIHGVALTKSGRELFSIVKPDPVDSYSHELVGFFEKNGFWMIEVSDGTLHEGYLNGSPGLDSQ